MKISTVLHCFPVSSFSLHKYTYSRTGPVFFKHYPSSSVSNERSVGRTETRLSMEQEVWAARIGHSVVELSLANSLHVWVLQRVK